MSPADNADRRKELPIGNQVKGRSATEGDVLIQIS